MVRSEGRLVYEFGDFQLDGAQRVLLIKPEGRTLPLTSRSFETLLYFVQHPGELLDKATLMKAVWPNVVVEENNLNQSISLLRRVLGENPGEYRFIVTVPGRGYRFVADVRTVDGSSDSGVAQEPAQCAAESSQPQSTVRSRTSIAVLPFANLTGDPAKEYFGDGIAEELINTLMRARWFRVPARTSAFAYKGRNIDVRQIARDLDVDAVLEGSVRSAGEQVRITAQLVDGRTGHHLWSQSYDRKFENLLELQDELTVAIVDALAGYFVLSTAGHKSSTQDLRAYQLYLEAMGHVAQPTEHNLHIAMELLRRALARDPKFARAWHSMAAIRAYYFIMMDYPMPNALSHAEHDARQAIALDPSHSGAHAVLASIKACRGLWIEAEEEIRAALSLFANNPEIHLVHATRVAQAAGHLQRALEETKAAYRLAPAAPLFAFYVGVLEMLDGHSTDALRWIELAIEGGFPKSLGPVVDALAHLAMRDGRRADAVRYMSDALSPAMRAAGGVDAIKLFYAAMSEPSGAATAIAIAALQALQARLRAEDVDRSTGQRLMIWYTLLGAVDCAHDVADSLLDRFALSDTVGHAWGFLWMPEMLAFRCDTRFQAFVSRLGLVEYWQQYGPPDGCELRGRKLIRS